MAELAASHSLELLRTAYLLCGDRQVAEDLVQDVLLNMHRRFPDSLPLTNPVAYARRALINANISRARRLSTTELLAAVLPDHGYTVPDGAEHNVLWQALRRLPERQRAVLVLRFYLDLPDPEIADLLGCRRTTVRSLAARGLAAMRADAQLAHDGARDE